jgi:hypothetical protein
MPLALALRDLVLDIAPDAQELIYYGYAVSNVFTFTGKPSHGFCHIVAYEKYVNLGFNEGAFLPNRDNLLVGTGKKIRHIRIASEQDLKLPLRDHVLAAIERAPRQVTK